jgi:photosystem II stability/assembly factor-like uncharacterized protein
VGDRLNPRARRGLALIGVAGLLVAVAALYWLRPPTAPVPANTPPLPADVTDWQFSDRDHGWVLLNSQTDPIGRLFATGDGGAHWRALASLGNVQAFTFHFFDARAGAVQVRDAAGRSGLLYTADGGQGWRRAEVPPVQFAPGEITLAGPDHAYLFAVDGRYASIDGARSWQPLAANGLPEFGRLLAFHDALEGWAVAVGAIYRTRDAGQNWSRVALPLPIGSAVITMVFAGPSAMLVAGDMTRKSVLPAVYPSPDGGQTWEAPRPALPDLPTVDQASIPAFVDHDHWFARGATILWSTADGGQNWTSLATRRPGGLQFGEVRFTSTTDGWSLTYGQGGPVLLRTTDGGFQWAAVKVPRLG